MSETNSKGFEWHKRPKGMVGRCPVCGCPGTVRVEHRAVRPEEGLSADWLRRVWAHSKRGWNASPVFSSAVPQGRPFGPSRETCEKLGKAAPMYAAGKSWEEIAAALEVSLSEIRELKQKHAELWESALSSSMERVRATVESMAGTSAILEDMDGYTTRFQRLDQWAKESGKPMFEANGEMTLTRFFHEWYVPHRLFDATADSKEKYIVVLNQWRMITGDPPIAEITAETLILFRDALSRMRGIKGISRKSPNTVRGTLRHIQTIIDRCGPPAPRRRDCAGIIQNPPWVQPPREEIKMPRVITFDNLRACFLAAPSMDAPTLTGIKTAQWWRSLLAVVYFTGFRRKTLMALRWDWIDFKNRMVVIPPDANKSRKPLPIPLADAAIENLRLIRTGLYELVFPWPMCRHYFYKAFRKLQTLAGIPENEQFGLHPIRKTTATMLATQSIAAAQFMLGHATEDVTKRHYINPSSIVADAVAKMPNPWRADDCGEITKSA